MVQAAYPKTCVPFDHQLSLLTFWSRAAASSWWSLEWQYSYPWLRLGHLPWPPFSSGSKYGHGSLVVSELLTKYHSSCYNAASRNKRTFLEDLVVGSDLAGSFSPPLPWAPFSSPPGISDSSSAIFYHTGHVGVMTSLNVTIRGRGWVAGCPVTYTSKN